MLLLLLGLLSLLLPSLRKRFNIIGLSLTIHVIIVCADVAVTIWFVALDVAQLKEQIHHHGLNSS
jgi:hypothetical protein